VVYGNLTSGLNKKKFEKELVNIKMTKKRITPKKNNSCILANQPYIFSC